MSLHEYVADILSAHLTFQHASEQLRVKFAALDCADPRTAFFAINLSRNGQITGHQMYSYLQSQASQISSQAINLYLSQNGQDFKLHYHSFLKMVTPKRAFKLTQHFIQRKSTKKLDNVAAGLLGKLLFVQTIGVFQLQKRKSSMYRQHVTNTLELYNSFGCFLKEKDQLFGFLKGMGYEGLSDQHWHAFRSLTNLKTDQQTLKQLFLPGIQPPDHQVLQMREERTAREQQYLSFLVRDQQLSDSLINSERDKSQIGKVEAFYINPRSEASVSLERTPRILDKFIVDLQETPREFIDFGEDSMFQRKKLSQCSGFQSVSTNIIIRE